MKQGHNPTTPAQESGGGGVGAAAPPPAHYSNLFGPDGQPLNPHLRRALAQDGGGATLYVARFTNGAATCFALGCWVNPKLARPPAQRHTGYSYRLVARYAAPDRRELGALVRGLLALVPCAAAPGLGGAACFLDPWPVLRALPAGTRRKGPAVVGAGSSPHRPEPARVRGLRRHLAQVQAQLAQVRRVGAGKLARVGLPTSPARLWLTLPVGAELLGAAERGLLAQLAQLTQQLAQL